MAALKNKGRQGPAFEIKSSTTLLLTTLLLRSDRVFRGLGDAEFHHRLGLDLDRFAGLRVAAYASLAMRLHQTAKAGHNEDAVLLGLFNRSVGQLLQKCRCCLVGKFRFLGEMPN